VGPTVHNQRIERLWRDLFAGCVSYFYYLFYYLEGEGLLHPDEDADLLALQITSISLQVSQEDCKCFLSRNKCPMAGTLKCVLCTPTETIKNLIKKVHFSERGSNERLKEEATFMLFMDLLHNCEGNTEVLFTCYNVFI